MTRALVAPSDPVAPGAGSVRAAALPAASVIVPLFSPNAVVAT